jgi:hypothetical protein
MLLICALCVPPALRAASLSQADASAGMRLALERGANAAVDLLGKPNGFLDDPKVRIPLPACSTMPPRWRGSPASSRKSMTWCWR